MISSAPWVPPRNLLCLPPLRGTHSGLAQPAPRSDLRELALSFGAVAKHRFCPGYIPRRTGACEGRALLPKMLKMHLVPSSMAGLGGLRGSRWTPPVGRSAARMGGCRALVVAVRAKVRPAFGR